MIHDECPGVGCISYYISHEDGWVVKVRIVRFIINLWNNIALVIALLKFLGQSSICSSHSNTEKWELKINGTQSALTYMFFTNVCKLLTTALPSPADFSLWLSTIVKVPC